jgi:hypothetical protein
MQAYGRKLKPPVLVRACLDAEHEDLVEVCRTAAAVLTFDRGKPVNRTLDCYHSHRFRASRLSKYWEQRM